MKKTTPAAAVKKPVAKTTATKAPAKTAAPAEPACVKALTADQKTNLINFKKLTNAPAGKEQLYIDCLKKFTWKLNQAVDFWLEEQASQYHKDHIRPLWDKFAPGSDKMDYD